MGEGGVLSLSLLLDFLSLGTWVCGPPPRRGRPVALHHGVGDLQRAESWGQRAQMQILGAHFQKWAPSIRGRAEDPAPFLSFLTVAKHI